MPDALFVVDVEHEDIAVREARKLGIPVVAVVDSNCSPEGVDYIIPGNDDAMRAITLYATLIADAVLDGKASLPQVVLGEDEFVELDEDGKPKKAGARRKKAPQKPTAKVTRKAPAKKIDVEAVESMAQAAEVHVDVEPGADIDVEAADDGVEAMDAVRTKPSSKKTPAKKATRKKAASKKKAGSKEAADEEQ